MKTFLLASLVIMFFMITFAYADSDQVFSAEGVVGRNLAVRQRGTQTVPTVKVVPTVNVVVPAVKVVVPTAEDVTFTNLQSNT
jgi:hypothetical protein